MRAPPPVLDRDGNPHYHVEAIVDARWKKGDLELHVKWLGYPTSQNTWESVEALRRDCPEVVRACEADHPRWFARA
ncbi:TPA: hypothetical protein N0F65_010088 [Lagenidium giganteum]|uniref:Chromo domain-containing protein n=1 Tax=Lagenidium giganteum TaxID=4803 RepID=A0AAV2YMZ1_9STRA|nr:TPA: hypothetical protein N0F65_010088 [Lagenidium giganteum]